MVPIVSMGHNKIVSIGMKWSCLLVTQTPLEHSNPLVLIVPLKMT